MTQTATLAAELVDDPEALGYAPLLEAGDRNALVAMLNAPREETTEYVETLVGVGTIIEVMGLANGNTFLDAIFNTADFRHVKPLLEQGRLRLDSAFVRGTLASLVGTLLTQEQFDAFMALCSTTRSVSRAQQLIGRNVSLEDIRAATA